ncbi:MAG TPA: SAM-dependent methyltransferase [Candidatus Limnocylindrales bacterium]|nr:SAM-dependent methyltransferase [Candidatus Limnocylindrales bacterium]
MQSGKPSRTAWTAAAHRAAHQILEQGRIFSDPLALRILGEDGNVVVQEAAAQPSKQRMRIFIAIRTRFAEDALAAAVERGVRQIVVLGGGLDTYAFRNPFGETLRIFEVDHPATQAWKCELLHDAGIPLPSSLSFAPVDFECQTLAEGLEAVNFDRERQTFFTWLGVVPYLTAEAVWSTLAFMAGLPNGAHVVFDYSDPPNALSPKARASHDLRAAYAETVGEPWITYFEADQLRAKLMALGFCEIEDLGPPQIAERYLPKPLRAFPDKGGHIVRATTIR